MKRIRGDPHYNGTARKIIKILFLSVLFVALFSLSVFAEDPPAEPTTIPDLFAKAKEIILDIYTKIVGISTVLAALMSAVAVIGAKLSNNQHKVDQSWDWLKRIWISWAIINGIGAFVALISPYFQGLSTLT